MRATRKLFPREASVARQRNAPFSLRVIPTAESEKTTARLYRVQNGDTLDSIAWKFYGRVGMSEELHRLNRRVLGGSRRVSPGQILYLPDR